MVERGQIWEYVVGSRQLRVLIVSAGEYNALEHSRPWAVAVVRDTSAAVPGYLVPLTGTDPLSGAWVEVPLIMRVDPTALRRNFGFVGETTMAGVEYAIRELMELP